MTNEFEIADQNGEPVLWRKIKGRNHDAMNGREAIARGPEEIAAVEAAIMLAGSDSQASCLQNAECKQPAVKDYLTPQWTDLTPTQPGWYWWRGHAHAPKFMVLIKHRNFSNDTWLTADIFRNEMIPEESSVLSDTKGQWQGPIAPR